MKIKSIQKGWGENAMWFRVGDKYSEIREELKDTSWGMGSKVETIIYRVYDHEGKLVAEIEPHSSLTIFYSQ